MDCNCSSASIVDVLNSEIFTYLSFIHLQLSEDVNHREGYDVKTNNWKVVVTKEDELKILRCHKIYKGIYNCLYAIEYSLIYINHYDSNSQICQENGISEYDYLKCHFDVLCHKAATLKDLYFMLINEIYSLNIKPVNNRIPWNEINKAKPIIEKHNPYVLEHLENYFDFVNSIIQLRHTSTHEGLLFDFHLDSVKEELLLRDLKTRFPNFLENWEPLDNANIISHIDAFKQNCETHKHNVFTISRCFFCTLGLGIMNLTTPYIISTFNKSLCKVAEKYPDGICSIIISKNK